MKRSEIIFGLIYLGILLFVPSFFVISIVKMVKNDQREASRKTKWEEDCVASGGQVIYIHSTNPVCTRKGSDILGQYK